MYGERIVGAGLQGQVYEHKPNCRPYSDERHNGTQSSAKLRLPVYRRLRQRVGMEERLGRLVATKSIQSHKRPLQRDATDDILIELHAYGLVGKTLRPCDNRQNKGNERAD